MKANIDFISVYLFRTFLSFLVFTNFLAIFEFLFLSGNTIVEGSFGLFSFNIILSRGFFLAAPKQTEIQSGYFWCSDFSYAKKKAFSVDNFRWSN